MSPGVRELGPMWIKEITASAQKKRDTAFDMAARCTPGGVYREQIEMAVALYDAMLAGPQLLAAAVMALTDCADLMATPAGDALAAAIAKATGTPP